MSFIAINPQWNKSASIRVTRLAFFISPMGDLIRVPHNHIRSVIADPETFGLTQQAIENAYDMRGEQIGVEGEARKELLLRIINQDWIRIRRYRSYYSLNSKDLGSWVRKRIQDWAGRMLSGIGYLRENDSYMPVRISTPDSQVVFSINDVAQGHMSRLKGLK